MNVRDPDNTSDELSECHDGRRARDECLVVIILGLNGDELQKIQTTRQSVRRNVIYTLGRTDRVLQAPANSDSEQYLIPNQLRIPIVSERK